jgi:hypothetical protein
MRDDIVRNVEDAEDVLQLPLHASIIITEFSASTNKSRKPLMLLCLWKAMPFRTIFEVTDPDHGAELVQIGFVHRHF